jgi:transcriptional regulator with PAS, ATPase and Fis domain
MESSETPRRPAPKLGVFLIRGATTRPARPVSRPLVVGRDLDCDVCIEDNRISKQHVRLSPLGESLEIKDLGSRNGTFVNGAAIDDRPTIVRPGGVIRLGRALLVVLADVGPWLTTSDPVDASIVGGPRVQALARRLSATASASSGPILVEGESGTGKELFAALAHRASGRAGELVALNCAALPRDLVEAELFGHARGAFSGAERARLGLFRRADRGTLFLDELGELPLAMQAKLLRVLEDGVVRAVGEDREVHVDVRLVAATNRALEAAVESGAFREDLFHRLAAHRFAVPPLRARIEDLPLLASHFLGADADRLSVTAMERLVLHRWPGNVRELRNALLAARIAAHTEHSESIEPEHLPLAAPSASPFTEGPSMADALLRERLVTALSLREGNVSLVAKDLEMRRQAVYDHMKRLGIDPARYR